MKSIFTIVLAIGVILSVTSCSSNMMTKGAGGAAAGSLSASFVGAATDLILHGKVNTDRLARNAVAGAVGGGVTGAAVGHKQDVQAAQKAAQTDVTKDDIELQKKIGKDNYKALLALLNKQHSDAYRYTLDSTKSRNGEVKAAAYGIQALIDLDRGNADGVTESLTAFIDTYDKLDDLPTARKELKKLHKELEQERKINGIR